MWRGSPRLAAFAIVAGGAALGPVLLLGASANHYAYGFAAVYRALRRRGVGAYRALGPHGARHDGA